MAGFLRTEPQVIIAAKDMVVGLAANAAVSSALLFTTASGPTVAWRCCEIMAKGWNHPRCP